MCSEVELLEDDWITMVLEVLLQGETWLEEVDH